MPVSRLDFNNIDQFKFPAHYFSCGLTGSSVKGSSSSWFDCCFLKAILCRCLKLDLAHIECFIICKVNEKEPRQVLFGSPRLADKTP